MPFAARLAPLGDAIHLAADGSIATAA